MNQDYLLRMAENIGRFAAALFVKDKGHTVQIEQNDNFQNNDSLVIKSLLNQYIESCKFNEAENILFSLLEKEPTKENLKLADWFYSRLLLIDNKILHESNFSSAEIIQGMKDVKLLKNKIENGQ